MPNAVHVHPVATPRVDGRGMHTVYVCVSRSRYHAIALTPFPRRGFRLIGILYFGSQIVLCTHANCTLLSVKFAGAGPQYLLN
jgi:hypothetical protein